jgi:hypothetical protein
VRRGSFAKRARQAIVLGDFSVWSLVWRMNAARRQRSFSLILNHLDTHACPLDYPESTYLQLFPTEACDRHLSMLLRFDVEKQRDLPVGTLRQSRSHRA